jgi:uncharacterized protein YbaR (Trm112 family)
MVNEKHECALIKKEERVLIKKLEDLGWCLLTLVDPLADNDRWSIARNIICCPYCEERLNKNKTREIEFRDTHGNLKKANAVIPDILICQDPLCNRYLKGSNSKYCSIKCKNRNIRRKKQEKLDSKIRCPDCGSSRVSKSYSTVETVIYCQNASHKGLNAYKTTHRDSKDYGKKFVKVHWEYEMSDED